MKTFRGFLLGLVIACTLGAISVVMLAPRVYWTLADMDATAPSKSAPIAIVVCRTNVGDWGGPKLFWYEPTNSLPVTEARRQPGGGAAGRMSHDWNGDVRFFNVKPYSAPYTLVPWGYKVNTAPIGSSNLSVWVRFKIPSGGFTNPAGLFTLGPSTRDTNNATAFLSSALGFRASSTAFGFLCRSTTSGSTPGSTTNDAASLDTTPGTFSSLYGTVVDMVFTRVGTNVVAYINGVDRTSSFVNSNPAGWAKPIALGYQMLVSSGNNENMWYWPEPVYEFRLWNSALTSGQAANPGGVSGAIVQYTAQYTEAPADAGVGINQALTHLASLGGGALTLPRGGYRISTPIRGKRNTALSGEFSSYYPNVTTFVEGYMPAATTLVRWFDLEDDTIQARRDDFDETFMTLRQANGVGSYTNSSAWVRTAHARFGVQNLTIDGHLNPYGAGRGIWLDRIGSADIRNVGFTWVPGNAIYAVQVNALVVSQCSGSAGKGFNIRGVADGEFNGNFYDGAMGPSMWVVGNLNDISGVAEYAANPRTGAASWEKVTTVNPTTDTFTTTDRHKWSIGDVIRFVADGTNSLPTPLLEDVDYFVYPLDPFNYKIGLKYSDEIGKDGVLDGAGFLDITSAGVGTWYGGPGPSCGFLIQGDNNSLVKCRSASNWEDGLRLENARDNRVDACRFLLAGNGNTTNLTNIAGIKMLGATTDNSIIGCSYDTRNTAGFSLIGVLGDATSVKNVFIGNSWQDSQAGWIATSIAADNYVLDGSTLKSFPIDGSGKSTILIPKIAGFTPYAEPRATNATYIVYDSSGRRIYVTRDTTSGNSDYAFTIPGAGPIFWNSLTANGAIQAVNSGSPAIEMYLRGEGFNPMLSIQGWSTNYFSRGTAPNVGLQRHMGTNSSNYEAVSNGIYLGGYTMGGFFTNNANGGTYSDTGIYGKATETWETGKRGAELELVATQNGGTTLSIAMRAKPNGVINLPFQSTAPIVNVEEGDIWRGINAGTTNVWLRRDGAWVALAP